MIGCLPASEPTPSTPRGRRSHFWELLIDLVGRLTVGRGQWDELGYLYIKDRKADMTITGGYNVYCSGVEAEIHKIPGVEQVAAIGVPDEDRGEAACAVVVPTPNSHITEDDILSRPAASSETTRGPKRFKSSEQCP